MLALTGRVAEYEAAMGIPGDLGERAFRGWLTCELLRETLGWPCHLIVSGEVFDLLLLSARTRSPRVYVETKRPADPLKLPQHERETLDRCSRYGLGTLEVAYLTNGWHWRRYRLSSPRGVIDATFEAEVHVRDATAEELDDLLVDLRPR